MKFLSWSDFEWFKKKSKVYVGNYYLRCGGLTKKDQKIIFPMKQFKRHLTFSISKKRFDFHSADDKGEKNYKPIFQIPLRKTRKIIKKYRNQISSHKEFFPYNSKSLKKLIFVNPKSKQFLVESGNLRNNFDIPPVKLLKLKIKNMNRLHGNILFAYDFTGRFRGIVKCNHRKGGFETVSNSPLEDIFSSVLNVEHVRKSLIDEGLKYNPKPEYQWKIWLQFIEKIELTKSLLCYYILRITRLHNLTNS